MKIVKRFFILTFILFFLFIITWQIYDLKYKSLLSQSNNPIRVSSFRKQMNNVDSLYLIENENYKIPYCGLTICDNPRYRDLFNPNTVNSFEYTIMITFLWLECDKNINIHKIINESIIKVNNIFAKSLIQFKYIIKYYKCLNKNFPSENNPIKKILDITHLSYNEIIKKNKGLTILLGRSTSHIRGSFYLPNSFYKGLGFIDYTCLENNENTLSHELGHALGLFHTHQGYFHVKPNHKNIIHIKCTQCTSLSPLYQDIVGDFCSDTHPDFIFDLNGTYITKLDDCGVYNIKYKINKNIMSYHKERNTFSQYQINRMRCYLNLNVNLIYFKKIFK